MRVRRCGTVGLIVASLAASAGAQSIPLFSFDADAAEAGAEWSNQQMGRTPVEPRRRFLGPFASERIALTLRDLPAHRTARVTLTLYVVQSWDGSLFRGWKNTAFGPDLWSMDVVDAGGARHNLIRATFSNTALSENFKAVGALQSYPYPLSADRVTAGTGAAERGTLGYVHPQLADVREDSTYPLAFTLPHDAPTLTLAFAGEGLTGGAKDEHWGIAKLNVTLAPIAPEPPDPDGLATLFDAACGLDDPRDAAAAFQRLALAGDALVDVVADRVEPSPVVDVALLRDGIDAMPKDGDANGNVGNDLGQPDAAEENLVRLGWTIEPHLAAILDATPPGPARPRLARVVNRIRTTPSGLWSERQRLIALRLLAVIDTPRARELRKTLTPSK